MTDMCSEHWQIALLRSAVVCVVALVLTLTTIIAFEGREEAQPERDAHAVHPVCAIVFGAGVTRAGQPSPAIRRRMQKAIRLYREGRIDRLILTGGKTRHGSPSEAAVMARVASGAVSPVDIVLEEYAASTWENLLFSTPFARDCAAVIGVSDGYHLARIRFLAGKLGWRDLHTSPADELPSPLSVFRSVVREILAILYYAHP